MFRRRVGPSYKSFKNAGNYTDIYSIWFRYKRPVTYSAIGLGVFYAANLEEVPYSHRIRFMLCPPWVEQWVGDMGYSQLMHQLRGQLLPDSNSQVRMVKSVMRDLINVSGLSKDIDWEIHVVGGNNPPNAFILPGGKVFVFSSILPICKDADGLATVLSHELAHQICRHNAENMSTSPLYMLFGMMLYAATGSVALERTITNGVLRLPASRKMETEADYVGLIMMSKACFNPAAATGLWQRMVQMEQQQGMSVPEFLSTHPASSRRIEDIKTHLPEAERVRDEYCGHKTINDFFSGMN